jgi:hypothetical protein
MLELKNASKIFVEKLDETRLGGMIWDDNTSIKRNRVRSSGLDWFIRTGSFCQHLEGGYPPRIR